MPVPNQNIIVIHRDMPKKDFLQIKNEHWQDLIKSTGDPYALALYLYFASNADNYRLEISPQAIENAIGMPRSTYYKKFSILQEKGYIIKRGNNLYEFFEVAQEQTKNCGCPPTKQQNLPERKGSLQDEQSNLCERFCSSSQEQNRSADNIEINNRYIDKINIINSDRKEQQPDSIGFKF